MYTEGHYQTGGSLSNYATVTLTKVRQNHELVFIQLNYREKIKHTSCKTARIWENSDHAGTKKVIPFRQNMTDL